jgi:hypothetical protein
MKKYENKDDVLCTFVCSLNWMVRKNIYFYLTELVFCHRLSDGFLKEGQSRDNF